MEAKNPKRREEIRIEREMNGKRDKRGGIESARRDEEAANGESEPGVERYLLIGPQESSI